MFIAFRKKRIVKLAKKDSQKFANYGKVVTFAARLRNNGSSLKY
jgi:hypothetical protein